MAPRKLSNPLAVAVLAHLIEKPMHPYELASTMRDRNKHESIKLNYGSLYTVVESLAKHGLIVPVETQREGRRPERTIYALTDAGRVALEEWLNDAVGTPIKEYTVFEAALSLLPVLPPDEALALLERRRQRLEYEVQNLRATRDLAAQQGLPRLFMIEGEYWQAQREAELAWVSALVAELTAGTFEGLDGWRQFHESGVIPEIQLTGSANGKAPEHGREVGRERE